MREEDWSEFIESMRQYGGKFAVSLAECWATANAKNFRSLCEAFPEFIDKIEQVLGEIGSRRRGEEVMK